MAIVNLTRWKGKGKGGRNNSDEGSRVDCDGEV